MQLDWGQKILNVTQLFGIVCYLTDVVHVQNSTTSFLHLALFLLPLKSGCYPAPFVGTPLSVCCDLWKGNTALGFLKEGFVAEILYRMCVCIFEINPYRKFNGPKIWDPVNRTKRKETLVAGQIVSHRTAETLQAAQQEKNSSEINLSFVLLCLKCSFCGTLLGLMFVLVDLLFCRKVKMYR